MDHRNPTSLNFRLLRNLLEMWGMMRFQSLPSRRSKTWISNDASAGRYHSYHYSSAARLAHNARLAKVNAATRERLLNGAKFKLQDLAYNHRRFVCRYVSFTVPNAIEIEGGVDVVFDLSDGAHPHCVSTKATPSDLAYRLGVKISGRSSKGTESVYWVKLKGKKNLFKLNTFCDFFQEVPLEMTEKTPRRGLFARREEHGKRMTEHGQLQKRKKWIYTSENLKPRRKYEENKEKDLR